MSKAAQSGQSRLTIFADVSKNGASIGIDGTRHYRFGLATRNITAIKISTHIEVVRENATQASNIKFIGIIVRFPGTYVIWLEEWPSRKCVIGWKASDVLG